ncbi:hypothetical protein [Streptomyces mirabilis]|uniref:hypothetical protein n=1 Tax=Streptomyces mirabilis TaxID=68239 RepID=UPI00331D5112
MADHHHGVRADDQDPEQLVAAVHPEVVAEQLERPVEVYLFAPVGGVGSQNHPSRQGVYLGDDLARCVSVDRGEPDAREKRPPHQVRPLLAQQLRNELGSRGVTRTSEERAVGERSGPELEFGPHQAEFTKQP